MALDHGIPRGSIYGMEFDVGRTMGEPSPRTMQWVTPWNFMTRTMEYPVEEFIQRNLPQGLRGIPHCASQLNSPISHTYSVELTAFSRFDLTGWVRVKFRVALIGSELGSGLGLVVFVSHTVCIDHFIE